jgi:hypothetical protein
MPTERQSENPKRWYLVMVACVVLAFFVFAAGPRIGYTEEAAHSIGLMIMMGVPTLGIMGLRAELLQRKE